MNQSSFPHRAALTLGALASIAAFAECLPGQRRGANNVAERTRRLVEQFDEDGDGRLDDRERAAAREFVDQVNPRSRRNRGRGRGSAPAVAQRSAPTLVAKDTVTYYPDHDLYDRSVLRTIFLEFPQTDWSAELDDFYRTDVEVPATLFADGETYEQVGVGYRGNSSYFTVTGPKKSFNISIDAGNEGQRLHGYKTINLLNGHADPSFLRDALHSTIGNWFFPVLQANLVKLVINGENWGIYVNVQQYNNDFAEDAYGTRGGNRWKIPAGRNGGLQDLGPDPAAYQRVYQLKSSAKRADQAWPALVRLCQTLAATPGDRLEQTLPSMLDIDATLWFMALDLVLLDGDGYFSRGSDYSIYQDPTGRFRAVPYDGNEILKERGNGGARPASLRSGPFALVGIDDRPLTRLFEVPAWRARYLAHVRTLAQEGLDWVQVGAFCSRMRALIEVEVRGDEKALYGHDGFLGGMEELQRIVETRRAALLAHEDLGGPWPSLTSVEHEQITTDDGAKIRVRATVRGAASPDRVLLHLQDGALQPYGEIPMYDDGEHGDGASGDGVFGALTDAFPASSELRLYVEARAATDVGTTTFHPAAAEGRPLVVTIDGL